MLLFLTTRYCSYTTEYRGVLGVRLLFLRQPFVKFQKAIGFGFLRQRMVLVHLLRGHFLVQMVEVMELRGVVAETVQRNLPRARLRCSHLLETLVKAGVYAVVNAGVYAGVKPVFMLE